MNNILKIGPTFKFADKDFAIDAINLLNKRFKKVGSRNYATFGSDSTNTVTLMDPVVPADEKIVNKSVKQFGGTTIHTGDNIHAKEAIGEVQDSEE